MLYALKLNYLFMISTRLSEKLVSWNIVTEEISEDLFLTYRVAFKLYYERKNTTMSTRMMDNRELELSLRPWLSLDGLIQVTKTVLELE